MSWKISRLNTIWFPLAFEQTFIGQTGNEKKLTNHICCFRPDKSIHSVSNRNIRPWWCWLSWRIFNIFANFQPLVWVETQASLRRNRHMWCICSSRYAITNRRSDGKRYEIFAKKGNGASHARDRGKGEENSYFCRWKTWMGPFPGKVAILGMDGNMNSGSWPRDLVRFVRSGTLKTWGRLN